MGDLAAALPTVRVSQPPPRPAPDQVLLGALAAASDRDRLILVLAAYAGLRRAEIAVLQWADINLDPGAIRVHGKGGRIRVVPMHPLVRAELLTEYTHRRGGQFGSGYRYGTHSRGGCVFPGQSGGSMTAGAIGAAASRALGAGWTGHTLHRRARRWAMSSSIRIELLKSSRSSELLLIDMLVCRLRSLLNPQIELPVEQPTIL